MSKAATLDAFPEGGALRTVAPSVRRWSRKRLIVVGLGLPLLAAGGWYGHYWWTTGRFLETTDDAYVGGDVTVMAPKVTGFIAEVAVGDNQAVCAGDLLVRIDDRDYRAALAKTDAMVEGGEAALANLDATRHLQQADIAAARAELLSTQAEAARTRFDYDRYRQLSASQYASEQRFQQADADFKRADAAQAKATASVDAAERRLAVIDTQKMQARASLDQARAERDMARLNLGYTQIRAPVDGTVGNRSARTGAYAVAGAGLISLIPAHGLWVDANFKESQLGQMKSGQKADIVADVMPHVTFTGRVVSLAPATGAQFSVLPPENATGNFTKIVQRVPVRIRLDGDGGALGRLRPGLSVTAAVDLRGGDGGPVEDKATPAVAERTP